MPGEKTSHYGTVDFLFILTLIQFWWIAIWGIAYIIIDFLAGPSKMIELSIYFLMLLITMYLVHTQPELLERL